MGGHGGLNILPQKSWHVYNYEAREKVRRDEEAHAAEEQKQRDKQAQVEGEVRRNKLLDKAKKRRRSEGDDSVGEVAPPSEASTAVGHVNLFEGVVPPEVVGKAKGGVQKAEAEGAAEDAKHRLGYGCVSGADGVAKPWYLEKSGLKDGARKEEAGAKSVGNGLEGPESQPAKKGKRSIEQLRAERLQRENAEKERQRRLLLGSSVPGSQAQAASKPIIAGAPPKQRYNSAFGYGR